MMLSAPVDAKSLGLPADVWMLIAQKLKPADLNHFIRAAQLFKNPGMRIPVLKETCDELYARLYAMDISLPPTLRTADFIGEYQAAFKTVEKSQKSELALLRHHYPQIVNEAVAIQAKAQLENPNLTPLQWLEQTHQTLDNINIAIIRPNFQPLIQPLADMTEIPAAAQPTLLIRHKRHSDDELSEKSEHKSDHEEELDELEDSTDRVFKWRR